MIKEPVGLQDLGRRLYIKAKAEPAWASGDCTSTSARWKRFRKPLGGYSSAIRAACAKERQCGPVRGCALKARGIQSFEIMTAAKLSSQPRTESCVMSGNGHCEA